MQRPPLQRPGVLSHSLISTSKDQVKVYVSQTKIRKSEGTAQQKCLHVTELTHANLHHHGGLKASVTVTHEGASRVLAGAIATHAMHDATLINIWNFFVLFRTLMNIMNLSNSFFQ